MCAQRTKSKHLVTSPHCIFWPCPTTRIQSVINETSSNLVCLFPHDNSKQKNKSLWSQHFPRSPASPIGALPDRRSRGHKRWRRATWAALVRCLPYLTRFGQVRGMYWSKYTWSGKNMKNKSFYINLYKYIQYVKHLVWGINYINWQFTFLSGCLSRWGLII